MKVEIERRILPSSVLPQVDSFAPQVQRSQQLIPFIKLNWLSINQADRRSIKPIAWTKDWKKNIGTAWISCYIFFLLQLLWWIWYLKLMSSFCFIGKLWGVFFCQYGCRLNPCLTLWHNHLANKILWWFADDSVTS